MSGVSDVSDVSDVLAACSRNPVGCSSSAPGSLERLRPPQLGEASSLERKSLVAQGGAGRF